MPHTDTGLPFASGSHESYMGAVNAQKGRGQKTVQYLHLLSRRGPTTDHEAAQILKLQISSICSIRNGAIHAGLVEKGSTTKRSPYGGNRCRCWLLSRAGVAAVRELTKEQA